MWLVKLDKVKPQHILSRKIFMDVRDFFTKKIKHETQLVINDADGMF